MAESADDDWVLLARSASGDEGAFADFVERHQGRVVSVCHRLLGDLESARDASQEVFLRVFRAAGRAEPRGKVSTWLYRIAVNHCLNQLRRKRLVRWLSLADLFESAEGEQAPDAEVPDPGPDPERALEERQRWIATRRAIQRLPPGQRAVLLLARFEGLSYREIAEVLGVTEGAVESRLVRAMRKLLRTQEEPRGRVSS